MSGLDLWLFVVLFVFPLLRVVIYEAIDTFICAVGRRLTARVSDRIMIPLGLALVVVYVALAAVEILGMS